MTSEARLEPTDDGLVPVEEGWFVLNAREARWRHGEGRGAHLVFEGDTGFPRSESTSSCSRRVSRSRSITGRRRACFPHPATPKRRSRRPLCFNPTRWGQNAARSGTRIYCLARVSDSGSTPDGRVWLFLLQVPGRAPGASTPTTGGPSRTCIRTRGPRSRTPTAALSGPARLASGPLRIRGRPCTCTGRLSTTTAPSKGRFERTPATGGARGRADPGGSRALLQMSRLQPAGAHRLARAGGRPLFAVPRTATGAGGAFSGLRAALGYSA